MFNKDSIFLLSVDEYEKYVNKIPQLKCWWWLRSPGYYSNGAAGVSRGGSVNYCGNCINVNGICVRPAIQLDSIKTATTDRIVFKSFPWIIIDKENGIAIAEVPISFDKFDDSSNDYENSYIRKYLLDWYNERE